MLSTETARVSYTGDDTTTAFTVPFYFLDNAHIAAYLSDTDGQDGALTTAYTLTGAGNSAGGTLTMTTAPTSSQKLTIVRAVPYTQPTDLTPNGRLPAETIEQALDRQGMQIQRLSEVVARAPRFPVSSPSTGIDLPILSANAAKFLRVNVAGTGLEAVDTVADNGNYTASGTGAVERTVDSKLGEWVSVKDFGATGDGVTDDRTAVQAAVDAVNAAGGGILFFPPGTYLCSGNIIMKSFVTLMGAGAVQYGTSPGASASVLLRGSASNQLLNTGSAGNYAIINLELDGNNGTNGDDSARDTYGIAKGSGDGGFILDNCTIVNFTYGVGNSSAIGSPMITRCQFRGCGVGIKNPKDAVIRGNNFTGQKFAGVEINTGAVRVEGNLFEFQRTGTNLDEQAYGIYITSNANEVLIANNRFDRNAGNDIRILSGAKRPRNINIIGNQFMRAAWGTNVTSGYRCSVRVTSADNVNVVGNTFYAANSNPSTARGLICPRSGVVHEGCAGIRIKGNDFGNLANTIALSDGNSAFGGTFLWVQSGTGTNTWYLTDTTDPDGNPWTGEPSSVVRGTTSFTALTKSGSIGSLSADEWGWGDQDSLGFSTIYARVASGTPGDDNLVAYHDQGDVGSNIESSTYGTRSTDVETELYRDAVRYFVGASGSQAFNFKTRRRCMTYHVTPFTLRVAVDEATSGDTGFADFHFAIARTGTTALPTTLNGTVSTLESGLTFGWTGSGSEIELSIVPKMLGDEIVVTFYNNAANQVEFTAELKW